MSDILLDTLNEDLDPHIREYLQTNGDAKEEARSFLNDLILDDNLLSTDNFTTVSKEDDQKKTLVEKIAVLDEGHRNFNLQLSEITNKNRDLIIDINDDLLNLKNQLTGKYEHSISSIEKSSKIDTLSKFEVCGNEKSRHAIEIKSSILSNIDSVLDLLELPTLCKICILQGNYQEALEVSVLVKTLVIRFPQIFVFQRISQQVELELKSMTRGLIKLLNQNLSQKNLLKIFQILNKVKFDDFKNELKTESETQKSRFLKMIYLNARFKFINKELANLKPLIKFNKFTYLKRFIEICREFIFSSLSIYYSIFRSVSYNQNDNREQEDDLLLSTFITNFKNILSETLLHYLKELLDTGNNEDEIDFQSKIDGIILQVIYQCKSLAKFGVDFESSIVWDLIYDKKLIDEETWRRNLAKVKRFKD